VELALLDYERYTMSNNLNEKAAFAEWLARQHLRFDSRLIEAVYLPTGAAEDEVRLLEVNTGLFPDPGTPITPVETTPAITELPFHVWVIDVSPAEWKQIQSNPALLPKGWSLKGNQTTRRAG